MRSPQKRTNFLVRLRGLRIISRDFSRRQEIGSNLGYIFENLQGTEHNERNSQKIRDSLRTAGFNS